MQSLVLQLEGECLDSSVSILDVLRKALVVARKLGVKDFQAWIEKELNGYENLADIPPYRKLVGQVRALNPYVGWIPIVMEPRLAETVSKCHVGQRIGELEHLARSSKEHSGLLEFPFNAAHEQKLMEMIEESVRPTRHVSRTCIVGIVDAVRNIVLDWTLRLEENGILGEGLTFSSKEKETAAHGNYTINYHGPVSNSQIQQDSQHSTQSMSVTQTDLKALGEWLQTLKEQIAELKLNSADTAQIQADVQAAETQLSSPRPNRVVIEACMLSIKNIVEGCTGSLLAAGLLHKLVGL
jgi:AbiTii